MTEVEVPAAAETVRAKTIQVSVEAGSAREFPISVFPGCFVEYKFYTKGGNIGFGILLEKEDGALMPVLEKEQVASHEEAITGKIKCTQSGTLWFQWDNTHSWFTSKELVYSVTRQPLDEHGELVSKVDINGGPPSLDGIVEPPATVETAVSNGQQMQPVLTNRKRVKIILGTMTMSGQVNTADSVKILQIFEGRNKKLLPGEIGRSEIDTALMYQRGKTEVLLGEIFTVNQDLMTSLNVATKANPFKNYGDNLRPESITRQLRDSLKSLKATAVDLFYLHAPDHHTNIEDSLEAVNKLYEQGKFRRFGLSNYASWQVMEIWHLCDKNEWVKPTVYQGMYNVITREVEKELLPCLRKLGIAFYAYNPLAGGLLSGRYTKADGATSIGELIAQQPTQGRFALKSMKKRYGERYWKDSYFTAVQKIHKTCAEADISLVDASLRWLAWHSELRGKFHDGIILGCSNVSHLEENMNALELDATTGALPASVLQVMNEGWETCCNNCPSYNR